ncbi:hypothetical protein GCM10009839_76820 [Catenulispora yoronensis]|uniref:SCP domain-containing protein n=2 Tax=Catenulispora yoronensis TaxID=450799 RepID=A0ABP5GT10_9ACTN
MSGSRRPTSHRRTAPGHGAGPQRQVSLRTSAVLALVTGLAITTPLMLRVHKHEIALGPDRAFPDVPDAAGDPSTGSGPGSVDGSAAGSAAGAAVEPDRSATPVSRDATRSPAMAPTVQVSPDQATAFEAQVVTLTNAQRTAHGCPALRSDARLRLAAIAHSVDMRTRDYFAHSSPDGATPWTRIAAQGYTDPSAENIAMGQATPQAVVEAWMNSPGHRANILNCSSKAVGVGVQFGPGGPWWTQDFGYS